MSPASHQSFALTNLVANRALIRILRSRLGRSLGRRFAVVEYLGHRSGKRHQLVTQYATDGRTVSIRVGMAERRTWWRNFDEAQPLRLRVAGEDFDTTATRSRHLKIPIDEIRLTGLWVRLLSLAAALIGGVGSIIAC
jgi:hypothetical protein